MSYIYQTKGTCSSKIEVELDGNVVKHVKFTGGCPGNLLAIPKLVEGLTVEQVEEKLTGIRSFMPPQADSLRICLFCCYLVK